MGHVRWSVWRAYGTAAGTALLVTVFVSLALTQARVGHTVLQIAMKFPLSCAAALHEAASDRDRGIFNMVA